MWILESIAADGETRAMRVGFVGLVSDDNAAVGDRLVTWDLCVRDEVDRIGAVVNDTRKSLC